MTTWTIINGDTLCLNGRPAACVYAPGAGVNRLGEFDYDELNKDERRELLEALNGRES